MDYCKYLLSLLLCVVTVASTVVFVLFIFSSNSRFINSFLQSLLSLLLQLPSLSRHFNHFYTDINCGILSRKNRYNAERNVGLAKIYKSLKSHHENLYERPWLKPHPFLISIVEAQSSIREELYFIKEQKKAKEAKKKEEKEVEQP